jgi:hypothetical protein
MVASNASSILLQCATLECKASHEEAQQPMSLLDAKILLSLSLPHSCYLFFRLRVHNIQRSRVEV